MPYLPDRYLRTVEQTIPALKKKAITAVAPLNAECFVTREPVDYAHRQTGTHLTLREGDKWGDNVFDCAWFHFTGTLPAACEGQNTVMLIDCSGEGLVVDAQGEPLLGLTCVDSQYDFSLGKPGKWIYPYAEKGAAGQAVDFWMDAGCNDLFGVMRNDGRLVMAQIGVWNTRIWNLLYDMIVLVDYLKCSNDKSARYKQILYTLYDACVKTPDLEEGHYDLLESAARELVEKKGGDAPLRFTAIGHAHMDLAWLWPVRETKRKTARTFATALAMMDRYPDYVFGASQPQQFQWLKENYPGLYRRVQEKVAEGRFEVQGCMWVEADTNLSGGEALVRQILYGKRFFRQEFGKDVRTLWLPDVFGYNAALPQLLVKSGCDCFMTQKLSWSQHNKFPHQTFRWKGIDGTEIFTHMLPEETYNSPLLPRGLRKGEENYAESGVCDEALILFGIGDGGGGPGMEHLEAGRRVRNFYGLCPCEQGESEPMLKRLREKSWDRLPSWAGELYLERHQGTYTTSARSKRMNRKMEIALRELEFLSLLSGDYPKAALETLWKETLLYQFHDILPGSSIQRVYDESIARYNAMYADTQKLMQARMEQIAQGAFTCFNSLSWDREAVITRPDGVYRLTVPAMGYTQEKGEKLAALHVSAAPFTLENETIRATFDETGALVSCYDKKNHRESLQSPSGRFAVYQEHNADCWDIAIEYTDRAPEYFALESQSFLVEDAEAVCVQTYRYGASTIDARIRLREGAEFLTYDVKVDWQEQDVMLRTAFDTSVVTDRAGFDIQYGLLHRSNHENTLWDKAQFEVCGHKWVDLSESGWGVALLNDCKYGFRVKGSVIDMDILRAQHYPSDLTDKGEQVLSYALYPHRGGEQAGRVKEKAYEFNIPLRLLEGRDACAQRSLFRAEGVIIESVKAAEDGGDWILRAYEPYGTQADMTIALGSEYTVIPCDLMEQPLKEGFTADTISQRVSPFEIVTYRLQRR